MSLCNLNFPYVLIIAEKPKAAKKIAEALSENPKVCVKNKVSFWVFTINNTKYVVAPTVGHLFTLSGNGGFPVFEAEWKPIWVEDKKANFAKKYYTLLSELSRKAELFINACDYDIEGSVIGYLIILFFGDIKKAKRMKFSSLTKYEILNSFKNLSELDYNMINAGLLRHKVDWLWGINVSRALMKAIYDVVGKKVVLSAGRVQSPTLINIVNKENERLLFTPEPKFKLLLTIEFKNKLIKIYLSKLFDNINDLNKLIKNIIGKKAIVKKVIERELVVERPPPFNLGDLQAEAGRILNISPYKTERIAEELYLEGLISYPRTNSQQLPSSINLNEIIRELSKGPYSKLIKLLNSLVISNKYVPKQGSKTDPAHPAIHPTGISPKRNLSTTVRKVYELILRRFLASISRDAIKEVKTYIIEVEGLNEKIQLTSSRIVEKGWLLLYPYTNISEEGKDYDLKEGEEGKVISAKAILNTSRPSSRYTKVSLLKWMEDVEIGTESTRAKIIETLFKRGYVRNIRGYIVPTKLGIIVANILEKYFKDLTDVSLTSELDKKLKEVQIGKKSSDEVWRYYLNKINEYIYKFNNNKNDIGINLAKAFKLIDYKKCKICDFEEYEKGLCFLHYTAFKKVREALIVWRERAQFSEYETLKLLLKSKYTGKYVKEIIREYFNDESHAS